MSIQTAGLVTISVFYGLVFLVGVYASRKKRTDGSSAGLLVAGRRMPMLLGVFTMTATWVGGGYINGTAEAVYDSTKGLVWAQAPWGYALSLVLGGLFFAKRMRRAGFTTLLDPFERRYGKQVAAGLFVAAVIGEIFWSAAILAALGVTFGTLLGFDIDTAILISAGIAVVYTILGGLWSVAYTDVLQLIGILLGLGLVIPFALDHAGGLAAVWNNYGDRFGDAASFFPPASAWRNGPGWEGGRVWYWLDLALLLICGGIPWQVYFQRVLACRDETSAVRLSIFAGFGCVLLAIPAGVIGAIGATVDWTAAGLDAPPNPASVLPYVFLYLTPPVVAVAGLGAVAAAVMSSVDSSMLSASSMFAWNVYRPLFRPSAGDREIRLAMRVGVLVVGTISTALALFTQSVYDLWYLCADLVYVVLFPQLVMALWCRRANTIGAVSGMVVGLILRLGGGEPVLGIKPLFSYPLPDPEVGSFFPFRTVAMLASLATIWLVSVWTAHLSRPRALTASNAEAGPSQEEVDA